MNPVYIRLIAYSIGGMIAAMGLGTFDPEAGTLTLQLDEIAQAVGTSSVATAIIFALWGKK